MLSILKNTDKIIKDAESLKQPVVVLVSKEKYALNIAINGYVSDFKVHERGSRRKYIFFGEKKYFVILVADKGYYKRSLDVAVQMEHYEKAAEFKRKLDELNTNK